MNSLAYFKALADETRIRLVNILLHHELKVGEIVSILEMGQSRISRHLKILADAEMVKSLKEGVWGFYSIAETGPGRRFIDAVSHVFKDDPLLEHDLEKAGQIIEARSRNTMRFFDHVASRWDLLKREIIGAFDLQKAIFKNAGTYETGVDLGCGTGELLGVMKNHAAKVIGVDSSPRMIEEARKRFSSGHGESMEIRLGELEHLPMGDKEADLAVISLVLQYLDDPQKGISEVERILKPGGQFILAELDRHENEHLKTVYGVKWQGFDRHELSRWLEKNGFKVKQVEPHPISKGLTLNIFRAARIN
ncbi:MAG: metalloregulator ArsR/SmtB family transcription factor [Desulfobacteraceae bacterium]|nr:metalloregulator ArsR/SmtB family transcription factor [Desulfobacteraceae bacterium]